MHSDTRVIVLGAGPAGLATAGALRQRGLDCDVLERSDAVGSSWRNHYERLHLHTVKRFSTLPGHPWPSHVPTYPARAEVVQYLEDYATRFAIRPRFGVTVEHIARDGDRWRVRTDQGETRAREVVVATGYNRVPVEPAWPDRERFLGTVMHSRAYRHGRDWRGRDALVVGAGNSGAEIALDLWECGARVSLCVRSPVHVVPRDVLGLPAQVNSLFVMSRLPPRVADRLSLAMLDRVVGDLRPWGIARPAIGPVSQVLENKQIPLIDVGTVALIKQGKIAVVPGIERYTDGGVRCVDGRDVKADVVVLATGYRAGLAAFFDDPARYVDDRGDPRHHGPDGGGEGLHFLGYRNPLTGALHDIAREATAIADTIARRA